MRLDTKAVLEFPDALRSCSSRIRKQSAGPASELQDTLQFVAPASNCNKGFVHRSSNFSLHVVMLPCTKAVRAGDAAGVMRGGAAEDRGGGAEGW